MSTEKGIGLVLRLVDFSETSRVVTLYTREYGKVGAMAKGGRRLRGPLAGALDLLSVCRIVLIRKHSGSLDLLTEAELVKGFAPQRNNLQVLYAGYYFAELLLELTQEDDPHPRLFEEAEGLLRDLETSSDPRLVVRRFELVILRETGHLPIFDRCATCGGELVSSQTTAFSATGGGLLCPGCSKSGSVNLRISPGSVKILQVLALASGNQWRRLQIQANVDREIGAVTRFAITFLTGRNLRTAQFLSGPNA